MFSTVRSLQESTQRSIQLLMGRGCAEIRDGEVNYLQTMILVVLDQINPSITEKLAWLHQHDNHLNTRLLVLLENFTVPVARAKRHWAAKNPAR
jgi:hypothetical protein